MSERQCACWLKRCMPTAMVPWLGIQTEEAAAWHAVHAVATIRQAWHVVAAWKFMRRKPPSTGVTPDASACAQQARYSGSKLLSTEGGRERQERQSARRREAPQASAIAALFRHQPEKSRKEAGGGEIGLIQCVRGGSSTRAPGNRVCRVYSVSATPGEVCSAICCS